MGKRTLIHPVSLNAIRGSADLGGFDLGRISQVKYDADQNKAIYDVQIRTIPIDLGKKNPMKVREAFLNCFSIDVEVLSFAYTYPTGYRATISTCVILDPEKRAIPKTWLI